jgi:hypothetical protein
MEAFDDNGETNEEGTLTGKLAWLAILFGLIGIGVGIAGIVTGSKAANAAGGLEQRLNAQPDRIPELVSAVEGIEERLVKLGAEFVKLGRVDRQLQENMQAAIDAVSRDIHSNRATINEVSERLAELSAKMENWRPGSLAARPAPNGPETAPTDAGAAAAESGDGYHTIAGGDTLSGIAKRYGITLSQLQQANPTVNPRALQIGQRIVIPSP